MFPAGAAVSGWGGRAAGVLIVTERLIATGVQGLIAAIRAGSQVLTWIEWVWGRKDFIGVANPAAIIV